MNRLMLVRFGEWTLKGDNRKRFEGRIHEHVLGLLNNFGNTVQAKAEYGRLYLHSTSAEALAELRPRLSKVFGLHSFSSAIAVPLVQEQIEQSAVDMLAEWLGRTTASTSTTAISFRVTCRRVNKQYPLTAQQAARAVGGAILTAFPQLHVDLHQPAQTVHVELREQQALLYLETDTTDGAGGFPLGTSGRALALLSGGIDSPVAMWQAMRRGLELEAIHFHSYPYTSSEAQAKVQRLAAQLAHWHEGRVTLHLVPFAPVQEYLRRKVQERLWVTVMRRAMMRLAEQVAVRRELQALVTGDSLGQVASQTLSSLHLTEQATSLPVLRPLLMMDKQQIVDIASAIETLAISQLPHDDCCTLFVPPHPSTNPNRNVVEESERRCRRLEALLAEAVEQTETLSLTGHDTSLHAADFAF